jgi:hypothetical protein
MAHSPTAPDECARASDSRRRCCVGSQVVAVAVEVWGASTAATELLAGICAAVIPAALTSSLPASEQVDLLAALSHLCQR